MGTTDDETPVEAREKAAILLRDRHDRESEALAALMAAVSRRAIAEEVVERETGQIASRLGEMSRLGFDDATLAELGIDIADVKATRASRTREQPAQEEQLLAPEPPAEKGADGVANADVNARDEGAGPVRTAGKYAGGVRTTAHPTGSLLSPPAGVATSA